MRISDWSSDVCASDLQVEGDRAEQEAFGPDEMQPVDHFAQRMPTDFSRRWLDRAGAAEREGRQRQQYDGEDLDRGRKTRRASRRESVCQYVYISGFAVSLTKQPHPLPSHTPPP